MSEARERALFWWIIAAPPLAVAAFALLLGLRIPFVTMWFWPTPDTNIVEAAWLKDTARFRALAGRGESVNTSRPLRPELLEGDVPTRMTPLEAAVRSQSDEMVRIVVELGATATADEAIRLYCIAREAHSDSAAELLAETFKVPPDPCKQEGT